MKTVNFTEMKKGTKDEYLLLDEYEQNYIKGTADRILKFMEGLTQTLEGYKITRLEHSLQTATRAYNDKADEEMIVAALLHDIGDKSLNFLSLEGLYKAIGFDKRNINYPQLTDHYFTGDYPVKPIDELGDNKITQLSLLSTGSNN